MPVLRSQRSTVLDAKAITINATAPADIEPGSSVPMTPRIISVQCVLLANDRTQRPTVPWLTNELERIGKEALVYGSRINSGICKVRPDRDAN
jgi:hypothetical protein